MVSMGTVAQADSFRQHFNLPFLLFADREQDAYRAYGVIRGNLGALAGPRTWWPSIRALLHVGAGKVQGDVFQLGGSFVIDTRGTIVHAHRATNTVEWAATETLLAAVREAHRQSVNSGTPTQPS